MQASDSISDCTTFHREWLVGDITTRVQATRRSRANMLGASKELLGCTELMEVSCGIHKSSRDVWQRMERDLTETRRRP